MKLAFIFLLFLSPFLYRKETIILKKGLFTFELREGDYIETSDNGFHKTSRVKRDSLYGDFWRINKIDGSSITLSKVIKFKIIGKQYTFTPSDDFMAEKRWIVLDSVRHFSDESYFYYLVPDSIEEKIISINSVNWIYKPNTHFLSKKQLMPYAGLFLSFYSLSYPFHSDKDNVLMPLSGGVLLIGSLKLMFIKQNGVINVSEWYKKK